MKAMNKRRWSASELRRLPPKKRDAVLRRAAKVAENAYRTNSELTHFEAFGKDDLHGDSADTQTRGNLAC